MFEVKVPELGESVIEATVGRWLKKPGDPVGVGEAIVELETDKVNLEVASEQQGVLASVAAEEGQTVNVGAVLATVDEQAQVSPENTPTSQTEKASEEGRRATPEVRRLAKEQGVDISKLAGSGPRGRVMRQDVLTDAPPEPVTAPSITPRESTPPARPKPESVTIDKGGSGRYEERIVMSSRRQTIARRLVQAQQTAAMLTTFNDVDMSAILDLRKRRKEAFKERHGVNLGFMSFFTKAVVGALKAFPLLNAEIQDTVMVVKHYYDIGIAVATDAGLVVPVVRDADRMGFGAIEQKIGELATKARRNELSLNDLKGGTFTITNGGVFGSLLSTPILNAPQVGILGMHKIEERPIAKNGEVVIRPMMYLALSYDHRIVDGSEAVRFLVRVKELLEDPESLLLEG